MSVRVDKDDNKLMMNKAGEGKVRVCEEENRNKKKINKEESE